MQSKLVEVRDGVTTYVVTLARLEDNDRENWLAPIIGQMPGGHPVWVFSMNGPLHPTLTEWIRKQAYAHWDEIGEVLDRDCEIGQTRTPRCSQRYDSFIGMGL